ncbi:MAG: hypothetical protein AAF739_01495 [Pseudomonadota bacterium]
MAACFELFGRQQLLPFQLFNLALIGLDRRWTGRIGQPVEEAVNLLINCSHLTLERFARLVHLRGPLIPSVGNHRLDDIEQSLRRPHGFEDGRELTFNRVAANRLAVTLAALCLAQIVSVALAGAAARPTRS